MDDGFLLGTVSGTQRSSRRSVYVGRHSGRSGFEFAGSIDDVRIYSVALSKSQIVSAMHGESIDVLPMERPLGANAESVRQADQQPDPNSDCHVMSDPEDKYIPAAACLLGVLAAVACAGLGLSPKALPGMAVSLTVGLLLIAVTNSRLPRFNLWLIPLTSLVGSLSVAASLSRRSD